MKSYTIRPTGKSAIAAALATQLAPGKAGEILVRKGFSQGTFASFLANLALRAANAGYDETKLADLFRQMAAGNASQAKQACEELAVKFEDADKEISLSAHWGKSGTSAAPIDTAALEAL